MRRKASEPDCGLAFRILYDIFLYRKQSRCRKVYSDVIVDTGIAEQVC